jgi:NADH-quinone oxidoreductase subunit G
LWYKGADVIRVTGRKDQWGEVEEFICNTCRFEKKNTSNWVIEGPSTVIRASVISQNHYEHNTVIPEYAHRVADVYKKIDDTPKRLNIQNA